MKVKRQKRVNRFMSFFKNTFGFREPFQVLVDGTFCQAALRGGMAVRDQVTKYLGGEKPAKILTTCCAVVETDSLGNELRGASLILKTFPVHVCGHEKSPVSGAECVLSMVSYGNRDRYIVASQDKALKTKLRELPGVPLMYVHYRGPILEKPSAVNESTADNIAESRLRPSEFEVETLKRLKKEVLGDDVDDQANKRKKRKRIKGANPLSCKKKKMKVKAVVDVTERKAKRRKRTRIRVPKHVKEHLAATAAGNRLQ